METKEQSNIKWKGSKSKWELSRSASPSRHLNDPSKRLDDPTLRAQRREEVRRLISSPYFSRYSLSPSRGLDNPELQLKLEESQRSSPSFARYSVSPLQELDNLEPRGLLLFIGTDDEYQEFITDDNCKIDLLKHDHIIVNDKKFLYTYLPKYEKSIDIMVDYNGENHSSARSFLKSKGLYVVSRIGLLKTNPVFIESSLHPSLKLMVNEYCKFNLFSLLDEIPLALSSPGPNLELSENLSAKVVTLGRKKSPFRKSVFGLTLFGLGALGAILGVSLSKK